MQANEICLPFKNTSSEKDNAKEKKNKTHYTVSCLHSESNESQESKSSGKSRSLPVQKADQRQSQIDILKKYSKCFFYLKSGHTPKNHSAKYFWRRCNGKHHISIRNKEGNKTRHIPQYNSQNIVVGFLDQSKKILLQTARADAFLTLEVSSITSMGKWENM